MNEKGYTEVMVSRFQYMNTYNSHGYTVRAALLLCQELNKWFALENKFSSMAGTAFWTQLSEEPIMDDKRASLPFSNTHRHTGHNMEDRASRLGCLNLITPSKIIFSLIIIMSVCCIPVYWWNLSKYTSSDILIRVKVFNTRVCSSAENMKIFLSEDKKRHVRLETCL